MFRSQRTPPGPDEIYADSLAKTLPYGQALWVPEPQASGEAQIGDVGFFVEGSFHRLFNLDTNDPTKAVTFDWSPLFHVMHPPPNGIPKTYTTSSILVPKDYCTQGVESRGIHGSASATAGPGVSAGLGTAYACRESQGAVLALKSHADAETMFENEHFKKYILQYHHEWYAYATDVLGLTIKEHELVVIRGWIKTRPDWGVKAFRVTRRKISAAAEGGVGGIAGASAGVSRASSILGPELERHGRLFSVAPDADPSEEPRKDQSVFLKRFRVLRRWPFSRKMVAGAGFHKLPRSEDSRGASGHDGIRAEYGDIGIDPQRRDQIPFDDPLYILLDYILETTGVETAIASDGDVEHLLIGQSVVDFSSYLRRCQPSVTIDGTVGSLSMKDVIEQKHNRSLSCRFISRAVLAQWPLASPYAAGRLQDMTARVYRWDAHGDPAKLKCLSFLDPECRKSPSRCFSTSTDGKLMAASFYNANILVWRSEDGIMVQRIQSSDGPVGTLSFCPDTYTLVYGSKDGVAVVFDVRYAHVTHRLQSRTTGLIDASAYSPDSALIATGSQLEQHVDIWDAATGTCLHSFTTEWYVDSLSFSADARKLYVKLTKTLLLAYDVATGTQVGRLENSFLATAPRDNRVATIMQRNKLKIWEEVPDSDSYPRMVATHPKTLSGPVSFSPDGRELLLSCDDRRSAVIYDSRTGQLCRTFQTLHAVSGGSYSTDKRYVAIDEAEGVVEVFDAVSAELIARLVDLDDSQRSQFLPHSHKLIIRRSSPALFIHVLDIDDIARTR